MAASRVVVVVPRQESRLHDYLRKSLACVKDVEVVLDRRATATKPAAERRRQPSAADARKLLICSLVHCPTPPPPAPSEAPPRTTTGGRPRTLLWPALRLDQL